MRQLITVRTLDGLKQVEADLFGLMAIHYIAKPLGVWRTVHPSGLALITLPDRHSALLYIKKIEASGADLSWYKLSDCPMAFHRAWENACLAIRGEAIA